MMLDITWCSCGCQNNDCERNVIRLDGLDIKLPISMANLKCEDYVVYFKGVKHCGTDSIQKRE